MLTFLLGSLAFMGLAYGGGIYLAVRRANRERALSGNLSAHDGRTLPLAEATGRRAAYTVAQTMVPLADGIVTRVNISGVALSRALGFRLQGLTRATGAGLEGRLVVEGTRDPARARQLFLRDDVRDALRLLCGSKATFKAVNLYPDGDLVIDVLDGPVDDLLERALRFCEVIDAAAPHLGEGLPRLGATSGSSSTAAFSIEIRS